MFVLYGASLCYTRSILFALPRFAVLGCFVVVESGHPAAKSLATKRWADRMMHTPNSVWNASWSNSIEKKDWQRGQYGRQSFHQQLRQTYARGESMRLTLCYVWVLPSQFKLIPTPVQFLLMSVLIRPIRTFSVVTGDLLPKRLYAGKS